LEEIFEVMDDDHDGFVSAERINIEALPTDVLELFAPVLAQLEELGVSMNLETWIDRATKHFQTLSITEKSVLLRKTKNTTEEEANFQPQLNKNSLKIAQKTRSYSGHEGLYQHCQKQSIARDMRTQMQKNSLLEQEKSSCTFRPQIVRTSLANESSYILY
jgi:hypothetical protein